MAIYRIPVRIDGGQQGGGPWLNILHVSTQVAGQPGDLGEALDAIEALYIKLRAFYSTGVTITIGEGMIRDPLGSPEYVDDDRRLVLGSGSALAVMPSLISVVLGWRTGSATRSGRGRTFLGPLVTTVNDQQGSPTAAFLTLVNDAALDFVRDSQSANGWAFGILSTKQGTFREVTGVSIRDRFAFLSSRRD